MSQGKIDIVNLPEQPLYTIFDLAAHKIDEQLRSNIASAHPIFGMNVFQTDRLRAKLSLYIVEGKMERVFKLWEIRPDFAPEILFALAGSGEQDNMKQILKACPELFFTYAPLKDISGVSPVINVPNIKGITVFQHAVWTGDIRYMCNMMLDCLPQDEKGEAIRIELKRQYDELMDKGVVYEVDGKRYEEKQFSLQTLLDALRDYSKKSSNEKRLHWCTVVGLAQSRLPAIFRHHLCDADESFWKKTPTFLKEKLTRSLKFYNYLEGTMQSWGNSLPGLGSKFGITNGALGVGATAYVGHSKAGDLEAITALERLCKVRKNIDHPALIQRLQSPIPNLEASSSMGFK